MVWLTAQRLKAGDGLFPSQSRLGEHLTMRHYRWWVHRWVALDSSAFGTHSLRRTKVAPVYRRNGKIRACQLLLGHTKPVSTIRQRGIEVDDALIRSEQTEI